MFATLSICRSLASDSGTYSGTSLYREIYRLIRKLPEKTQLYYRNYARQNFTNYNDETDPEVLKQLHEKARHDAAWVVHKYSK